MESQLPEIPENQLPRLTTKEIQNEAFKYFNLEKGLLFTFLSFLRWPHKSIQTFLNVDRRKFSNPIQYVVIGVGLYVLLISFHPSFKSMNSFFQTMNEKNASSMSKDKAANFLDAQTKSQELVFSYQNAFYLLGIPLISLLSLWLIGGHYNYAENMVINAYVFGTTMWASTIITILTFFIDYPLIIMPLLMLISFVIIVYLYKHIFNATWLMSFITMVLTQGLLMFMIAIIQAIFMAYFMFT